MRHFDLIAKTPEALADYLAGVSHMNCSEILDVGCEICPLQERCRENDFPLTKEVWLYWLNKRVFEEE